MAALEKLSAAELNKIFTAQRIKEDVFNYTDPENEDDTIFDHEGKNPKSFRITPEMPITIISYKIQQSLVPDSEYIILNVLFGLGKFDKGTNGIFKVEHALGRAHYNQDSEFISLDLFYDPLHLL